MKRKYRRVLLLFIAIFIICVLVLLMVKFFHNLDSGQKVNVVDSVENYDYVLEDRDTVLYKNIYNELKNVLDSDSVDNDKYAELVSKLFITDLFTMANKLSKYDVGGADFVYPDNVANYKLDVEETLYKTLKNNADGKRKQDLPVVKDITLASLEKSKFKIGETEVDSIVCTLNWTYEKDYGYDTDATVTLVNKDDRIYVVEYQKGDK